PLARLRRRVQSRRGHASRPAALGAARTHRARAPLRKRGASDHGGRAPHPLPSRDHASLAGRHALRVRLPRHWLRESRLRGRPREPRMRRRVVTVEALRKPPPKQASEEETPKERRRAAERIQNAKIPLTYRPFAGLKEKQ